MLFQRKKNTKKTNRINQLCPLQIRMQDSGSQPVCRGKASFSVPFWEGSMTVEAALILPFFLIAIVSLLYFIVFMQTQIRIQNALNETARELAQYAYGYQQFQKLSSQEEQNASDAVSKEGISGLDILYRGLNGAYALMRIRNRVGTEWLNTSCIEGGSGGLMLMSGDILSEDEMIDLALTYRVRIPYFPGEKKGFTMVQRCRVRAWTGISGGKGDDKEKLEEEIVYITDTGSVYHKNLYCTYLNLSIQELEYGVILSKRNSDGEKYHACELCIRKGTKFENSVHVWISDTGNRYHGDLNCSGLKRNVKEIPISQVGGKTPCKRCGSGGGI